MVSPLRCPVVHGRHSRGKGTIRHLYLRYHAFLEANDDSNSDDYEEALALCTDTAKRLHRPQLSDSDSENGDEDSSTEEGNRGKQG